MKNYTDSDYAVNKYSKGIVYRFSDTIIEITLEDYLRENPDLTEIDFYKLKALSDEIYLDQVRLETAQGNKTVSINDMEETEVCATRPLDEEYVEEEERKRIRQAAEKLLQEGCMTEKQKRRFYLHYFEGLTLREIANIESVHFTSVGESIETTLGKLKRYFLNNLK